MGRIQQMDDHLATLIAAGEVVTGPGSVVKELVDNALDAGATSIDIAIEGGGLQSIRVADNGSGMDEEDAILCLSRHATSKLTTADDLMSIRTMGFRGEALAAILSVSHMRIETQRPGDSAGTLVRAAGGELQDVRSVARRPGTTVEVSSLFYNTPARREFQDSARAEGGRVLAAVQQLAIARPDVRFTLRNGNREVLNLPPVEEQLERIRQIYESEFADSLLPIFGQRDDVVVTGFVTQPSAAVRRARRSTFLVNARPFESFEIKRLLATTFSGVLSAGEHAEAVVYIDVPPGDVDVNVSPDKSQVRFRRMSQVLAAVADAFRYALGEREATASFAPPERPALRQSVSEQLVPAPDVSDRIAALKRYEAEERNAHPEAWEIMFERQGGRIQPPDPTDSLVPSDAPRPEARSRNDADVRVPNEQGRDAEASAPALRHGIPRNPASLLQVMNTFLVCATDEGMLIVDQHSAHERVNYERFRAQWESRGRNSDVQPLMFPEALKLDVQRVALLKEMEPYLERLGFELSPAGPREMLVNAVPAALGEQSVSKALESLMDAYSEARAVGIKSGEVGSALTPVEDRLLMTMACHAAIKSGQALAETEMRALWKDLVRVDLAAHDVHGRPAVLTLSGTEIARRMGRAL